MPIGPEAGEPLVQPVNDVKVEHGGSELEPVEHSGGNANAGAMLLRQSKIDNANAANTIRPALFIRLGP